ncbi:MAG: ATP synthase F0 subunit B [Planctomycetaceae bacterium]|nr:ATP synthase F0 subunit B [Planctomycetaceae bacterium]
MVARIFLCTFLVSLVSFAAWAEDAHTPAAHAAAPGASEEHPAAAHDAATTDSAHPPESTADGGGLQSLFGQPWAGHPDTNQPPLKLDFYLLIFTFVLFLLFIRIMKGAAWGPMIAGLNEREARVVRAEQAAHQARHEAERLRTETEARMAKVHAEVKALLAQARSEAEAKALEIISKAEQNAQQVKESALAEIAEAQQRALAELDAQVESQVALATTQLLGR